MRQITIKEFHQNMWEEIKNLPCEVTRNNVPIFKVSSVTVGELKEVAPKNFSEEDIQYTGGPTGPSINDSVTFKLCKAKFCNKFAEEGSDFCKEHK